MVHLNQGFYTFQDKIVFKEKNEHDTPPGLRILVD